MFEHIRSEECFEGLQNEFNNYDATVDVISVLESFFSTYSDAVFFDRFPRIPKNTLAPKLTPDATVLFENSYGIIFEVKRTLPKEETAFSKKLDQLEKYDQKLSFKKNEKGDREIPET